MTSLQYQLLILLNADTRLSSELYGVHGFTDSHVRRTLIKMIEAEWVTLVGVLKQDSGQGRPTNQYDITELGRTVLADYQAQLESLR